ncbi:hypothetical protein [Alteromonas sp. ASW11-130]|uniref:hypothetical protein n=1 Tax=Alteromonas sp. ASW11-130 TaxID=3015775 RepID=UPI002241C844|nr:hypothetical protein [Alteromonas sp. ASW11-130]MCW8092918.1 hypothetical protein [Alteromonas sp. ASW11-130]
MDEQAFNKGMAMLAPVTLLLSLVVTALLICNNTLLTVYAMKTETHFAERAQRDAQSRIEHLKATLLNADATPPPLLSGQTIHAEQKIDINGLELPTYTLSAHTTIHRSERTITEAVIKAPILLNLPTAPLSVLGSIPRQTIFELGIPDKFVDLNSYFSLWSRGVPAITAKHQVSCRASHFNNGECLLRVLSSSQSYGPDFYIGDTDFPSDLILFLFGLQSKFLDALSQYSAESISTCKELNEESSGMYIIDSDCTFPVKKVIGTPTAPVLLISINSNVQLEPDVKFFGLLVSLCIDSALSYDIKMHASASIFGALMANCTISKHSYIRVRFSQSILNALRDNSKMQRLYRIPGSWRDF